MENRNSDNNENDHHQRNNANFTDNNPSGNKDTEINLSNSQQNEGNANNQPNDSNRNQLTENREKSRRVGENRIMAGILLVAVLVVGGFLLTWTSTRGGIQKPLQQSPSQQQPSPPVETYVNTVEVINERVNGVPGVEGSQVIVLSRVALVAIKVQPDLSAPQVKRIKNECEAVVRGVPEVDEALVTANRDLGEELQKILQGEAPLERLDYIYERIRDQHL